MKKILFTLIIFVLLLSFGFNVYALNDVTMLSGDQDLLVLGSVKDITEDSVIITVDHVLGSPDSKLVGKDITVESFTYSYCELHTPSTFNMPVISDNVVISLDLSENGYIFKNGAYKVDSNDHVTCRIIKSAKEDNHECILELAEITCYIRSNAKVNTFEYDSEGNIYAVYPQKPDQCIVSVDQRGNTVTSEGTDATVSEPIVMNGQVPPDASPKKDFRWVYAIGIFVLGTVGGLLAAYIYLKNKKFND